MEALETVLIVVGAYFFGAIPTSYWMARVIRGIDIRQYGSGNVGISNFARHVGKRWAVPVILFDVAVKGPLPVILASSKVFDLGLTAEMGVGLAVIVGHNWSVFIRFSGGRGMGTVLGVVGSLSFVLVWMYLLTSFTIWLLTWALTGRRDSALSWIIAAALLPVYSVLIHLPLEITYYGLIFLGLTTLKRAITNDPAYWLKVGANRSALKLLFVRVIFDRDTLSREGWVGRSPVVDLMTPGEHRAGEQD